MLRPKLVLLLTDVLSELSLCFSFCFRLSMLKRHEVFYTSAIPEVTWYEPLYNNNNNKNNNLWKIIETVTKIDGDLWMASKSLEKRLKEQKIRLRINDITIKIS